MHHYHIFRAATLAAVALLAACDSEPEVVGGYEDPDAPTENELAEVELPPMEASSGVFRCADNSVVYVTFYTDNSQVGVRTEANGQLMVLPAETVESGGPTSNETDAAPAGPVRFTNGTMTVVGTESPIQYGNGGDLKSCRS